MLERLTPDERAALLAADRVRLRVLGDCRGGGQAGGHGAADWSAGHDAGWVWRSGDFAADAKHASELAERFVAACRTGDVKVVEGMLTHDIELYSDGGGKLSAARVVIRGPERVARFMAGVFRKQRHYESRATMVNGKPGWEFLCDGKVVQVMSLDIEAGVRGVYFMLNPDKLMRWSVVEVK